MYGYEKEKLSEGPLIQVQQIFIHTLSFTRS